MLVLPARALRAHDGPEWPLAPPGRPSSFTCSWRAVMPLASSTEPRWSDSPHCPLSVRGGHAGRLHCPAHRVSLARLPCPTVDPLLASSEHGCEPCRQSPKTSIRGSPSETESEEEIERNVSRHFILIKTLKCMAALHGNCKSLLEENEKTGKMWNKGLGLPRL